jgi:hypothetical protein
MSWFQQLFGGAPERPRAIVIHLGPDAPHAQQALCVALDCAYLIDLSALPADTARIHAVIGQIAAEVANKPIPVQVWVVPTRLLELYVGDTAAVVAFTSALHTAIRRVEQRMMVVEPDAPASIVFMLRSLGFKVFEPGLQLRTVDPQGHLDVLDVAVELDRVRSAWHVRARA